MQHVQLTQPLNKPRYECTCGYFVHIAVRKWNINSSDNWMQTGEINV